MYANSVKYFLGNLLIGNERATEYTVLPLISLSYKGGIYFLGTLLKLHNDTIPSLCVFLGLVARWTMTVQGFGCI